MVEVWRTRRSGGSGRARAIEPSWTRRPRFAQRLWADPSWRTLRLEDGRIVPAAAVSSDAGSLGLAHPSGRGITKTAGGRVSGIAASAGRLQRAAGRARAPRAGGAFPLPSDAPFVSDAEPSADGARRLAQERGRRLGLEVETVDASFGEIDSLLRSAGPAVIRIGRGHGRDARETTRTPADRDRTRPSGGSSSGRDAAARARRP